MQQIINKAKAVYFRLSDSIAFYPTLIAAALGVFGLLMMLFESTDLAIRLKEQVPFLVIDQPDTARTILSAIVGSIISLMVFSFSMVMVVLSQAASNYSPRVLPELTSERAHQWVLGVFLGTTVYCLILLMNILPEDDEYQVPGLAIFVGILLAITCLGMFVYFIHTISNAIRVNKILKSLYLRTSARLTRQAAHKIQSEELGEDTDTWIPHTAQRSGYLEGIVIETLLSLAAETDNAFYITVPNGTFFLENVVLIKAKRPLDDAQTRTLHDCILANDDEIIEANYLYGFKQLTEVAVKAMSPGINDPGTASSAIDYLMVLFAQRIGHPDSEAILDKYGHVRIRMASESFAQLIVEKVASIVHYSQQDTQILLKVLNMFEYLARYKDNGLGHEGALRDCIKLVADTANEGIAMPLNRQRIATKLRQLDELYDTDYHAILDTDATHDRRPAYIQEEQSRTKA